MLTSEEKVDVDLLTKQETREHYQRIAEFSLFDTAEESTLYELRELLTLIKSNTQLMENSHPELQDLCHWEEISLDLDTMADKLAEYEREIHNNVTDACYNIQ